MLHRLLMYRDRRLEEVHAAAMVEVVEHLEPPRLLAFGRVLFAFAKPRMVVRATLNRGHNAIW